MASGVWSAMAAVIPATAAVGAALVAAGSARSARRSQAASDHLNLLEERLADRKREVYQPLIELLGKMFDLGENAGSQEELVARLQDFMRWVTVVGSDDAVRAFRNLMQAAYNNPPPAIYLRLYAEFQLAARRDMGDPATTVTPEEILGMKLTDLYSNNEEIGIYRALTLPFDDVCREHDWEIPWRRVPGAVS